MRQKLFVLLCLFILAVYAVPKSSAAADAPSMANLTFELTSSDGAPLYLEVTAPGGRVITYTNMGVSQAQEEHTLYCVPPNTPGEEVILTDTITWNQLANDPNTWPDNGVYKIAVKRYATPPGPCHNVPNGDFQLAIMHNNTFIYHHKQTAEIYPAGDIYFFTTYRVEGVYTGGDGGDPDPASDKLFVADTGGQLDAMPNNQVAFDLNINRYYGQNRGQNPVAEYGFIEPVTLNTMVSNFVLPAKAKLKIRMYIDPTPLCTNLGTVQVNNKVLTLPTINFSSPGWTTVELMVNTADLKFPYKPGTNWKPRALNSIQLNTTICNHQIKVDWASLEILTNYQPVVFVHGWTGHVHAFDLFDGWMTDERIPVMGAVDMMAGIQPIPRSKALLKNYIRHNRLLWGVDEVTIFAHSRGGLVARLAVEDPFFSDEVSHLITFSSPHHGIPIAYFGAALGICYDNYGPFDFWPIENIPLNYKLCVNAVREMTKGEVESLNYKCTLIIFCTPKYVKSPDVIYGSLGGYIDTVVYIPSATYPWNNVSYTALTPWNTSPKFPSVHWAFWDGHTEIIQGRQEMECALSFVEIRAFPHNHCPRPPFLIQPPDYPRGLEQPPTAQPADDSRVLVASEQFITVAGESTTQTVTIDPTSQATFELYATDPVSMTLLNPAGDIVTPISGTVTNTAGMGDFGYQVHYVVDQPQTGEWQIVTNNAITHTYTTLVVQLLSTVDVVLTRPQTIVAPGELMTVTASLQDGETVLSGATFTGTVTFADYVTTAGLTFYDDGSHGDEVANDHRFTAEVEAPNVEGYTSFTVQATTAASQRIALTSVMVSPRTGQIDPLITELPLDFDNNGLYDQLTVGITVTVPYSGYYRLAAELVDPAGETVAYATLATTDMTDVPLEPGSYPFTLAFEGTTIAEKGLDGPYTLRYISLTDETNQILSLDFLTDAYTTTAYTANQFERPNLLVMGTADELVDTNGNNLADYLDIEVDIDAYQTGVYQWEGRLYDANYTQVAWAQGEVELTGRNVVTFRFNGTEIYNAQLEGPYTLGLAGFTQGTEGENALFSDVHTTAEYSWTQFEPPAAVGFSHSSYVVDEGAGQATITVTLSAALPQTTTVNYNLPGSIPNADYGVVSGTLTFAPQTTTQTFTIPVTDDGVDEDNQWVSLELQQAQPVALDLATAQLEIVDNDAPPTLSLSSTPAWVEEGQPFTIQATLNTPSEKEVSVTCQTNSGTATAGLDFTPWNGLITLPANTTNAQTTVLTLPEVVAEKDETFTFGCGTPINVTLANSSLSLGIPGNDELTFISPMMPPYPQTPAVVWENSGSVNLYVHHIGPIRDEVAVQYQVVGGTAEEGKDYILGNGTLFLSEGQQFVTFPLELLDDTAIEGDETVIIELIDPLNAGILEGGTHLVTIKEDDVQVTLATANQSVPEGLGWVQMVVQLSAPTNKMVQVQYATSSPTKYAATAGVDYVATAGTLTFAPGEVSKTVWVQLIDDLVTEGEERFSLTLSNPTSATIGLIPSTLVKILAHNETGQD